jgi:Fe-S-cluster containining protein
MGQQLDESGDAEARPAPQMTSTAGPLERSLEDLWDLRVRHEIFRLRHLPHNIRLFRRYRLRFVQADELTVDFELGLTPHCPSCTDLCCRGRGNSVPLRLHDIARLVDRRLGGLVSGEHPRFTADELAESPARRRFIASDIWRIFPVLRQRPDETCVALGSDGRCRLHPDWPLACAKYPYFIDPHTRILTFGRRCPSRVQRTADHPHTQALLASAIEYTNRTVKDLLLVHYAWEDLAALGLDAYLRRPGKTR